MDFSYIAFWVFAIVTGASALAVITVRNPVYAVLCLVLTFFSTACLWLLLEAEFLGIVLVLVYVGAVMVLFLFVVMMLDINVEPLREGFIKYLPLGLLVAAVMFLEMIVALGVTTGKRDVALSAIDPAAAVGLSNVEWLARALFSEFMLPFEIAAVILTVALIAAIVLTLRRREGVKTQDPARQVLVRREDRIRLVKMPSEGRVAQRKEEEAAP